MDLLGIATDAQARQRALGDINIGRMSPAALHRLDPKRFAKPVAMTSKIVSDHELQQLRDKVAKLQARIVDLEKANHALRKAAVPAAPGAPEKDQKVDREVINARIRTVMVEFCKRLNEAGNRVLDEPWAPAHLNTPRKSMQFIPERHVCMWLCRQVVKSASTPMIGKAFGGRDHTTIMHGCSRVQHWFEQRPDLSNIARELLAHFAGEAI
jgi:hypothetical protein